MRTNLHEAFLSDVNNLPTFEIVVTSTSGSILVIDDDRLGANSLSFKYSNGDGALVNGGASISACSFTVMTFESDTYANFDYSDANVDIKIHINGCEGQYWHGYVTDAKQSYNTITVSCYDVLGRADEYTVSELNINFPISRASLVSAICTKIGADGFGGETISSAVIPTMDTSVTLRQALSYVAEAEAVSWFSRVYDDYTVYLIAKKIDWDTVYNIEDVFGRGLSQYQTSIDCVDVTSYDKTKSEAVGSFGDRTRVVSQNPCITADTFDVDIAKIKSTYLDESNIGRKFIAGTLTILSDPGLECCDVISVMHNSVVCSYVVGAITFKGTVTMALSMKQPTGDTADKRQSSAETQINSDLKDSNSNLSKAISEGGGGGSSTSQYRYITLPCFAKKNSSGSYVSGYNSISTSDVVDQNGNAVTSLLTISGIEGISATSLTFDKISFQGYLRGSFPAISQLIRYNQNTRAGTTLSDVDTTGALSNGAYTILAPIIATTTYNGSSTSKYTLDAIAECYVTLGDRDASAELSASGEQLVCIQEFAILSLPAINILTPNDASYCTNKLNPHKISTSTPSGALCVVNNDVERSQIKSNYLRCTDDFRIVAKLSKPF